MTHMWIAIIIAITIIMKGCSDGFHYLFDISKIKKLRKKYGIIYHLFGVASIGIPFFLILVPGISQVSFKFVLLGYALMYFGFFDLIYNRVTKHNAQYIGETDLLDIILGTIFNKRPFLKTVFLTLRWGVGFFGLFIILNWI